MTLKRKFLIQNSLLVLGLLLVGAISVWRLLALRKDVGVSTAAYIELKSAENAAVSVATARGMLSAPQANRPQIVEQLQSAVTRLDEFIAGPGQYVDDEEAKQAYVRINETAARARSRVGSVLDGQKDGADAAAQISVMDDTLLDLDLLTRDCADYIRQRQIRAQGSVQAAVATIGGLSLTGLVLAAFLSWSQYRAVLLPLQRLRRGVKELAAANFSGQVEPVGHAEFVELATDFNRMAAELQGFYRDLERKVMEKSRELVRSERLASVGFLAAGVAHEINNPLNVISGYAELTARQLLGPIDAAAAAEAAQAVQIIRDEAFRCKEITEKLLSLTRTGDNREVLSMDDVAREVAAMTRGIKNYRDREVTVAFDTALSLQVVANLNEMKQVLLNLTVNALEAVKPGVGKVCIEGRGGAEWVELSVKDNGRGMPADMLKHVFEPFFTDKKGAGIPGTGLGLSITHAIVESHGGRIRAESEGPGRGSRFTLQLPARGSQRRTKVEGGS